MQHIPVGEATDQTKPQANVGFSASYTKSLGDYESVKFGVSLHLPVEVGDLSDPATMQNINEAFTAVQEWVDEKMKEVLAELEG